MDNKGFFSMMGKLKEDKLEEIQREGEWYRFETLGDVLKRMETPANEDEDKHSIPDVYGRPFQLRVSLEAWMKRSAELKEYIKPREIIIWRGILTLMALQDFLHLDLKVDIIKYEAEGNAFDTALKYPPQSDGVNIGMSWENRIYHVVALRGSDNEAYSDVAMLSPMTLFYPVADIEAKMPQIERIKWFDGRERKFIDPIEVLDETEKMLVCFWLQHLENNMANGFSQVVKYHLDEFVRELQGELKGQNFAGKNCFVIEEIDKDLTNRLPKGLLNLLLNSTVKIRYRLDGINAIDYNDLFAEQIYYVARDENPFLNCYARSYHIIENTNDWHAFLPLGYKVGERYDRGIIEKVAHILKMQAYHNIDNEKIAYIEVNLRLSQISSEYVDASKRYYIQDGLFDVVGGEGRFPVIALWPKSREKRLSSAYVYIEGGEGKIKLRALNAVRGSNPYVEEIKGFPQTLSFTRRGDNGKRSDIGMILPQYDRVPGGNGAYVKAIVGIDFGTSGTKVYARLENDGGSFSVRIQKDAALLLTNATEDDTQFMGQYFIANDYGQEKLYSVYRRTSSALLGTVSPLLDGVIYQAHEKEMLERLDDAKQYMSNIKWENPNNGVYYVAFIEELCMHVWNELCNWHVNSVEWRYALPQSLTNRDAFHNLWQTEIYPFLEENIPEANHSIEKEEFTESEAASLYFLTSEDLQKVNADKGYMVIDIGGGSTDIAVWQKRSGQGRIAMVAQTSIPVAGRKLFTRWIAVNIHQIIEAVFPNDPNMRKELEYLQEFGEDSDLVDTFLERLIQINSKKIRESYLQGGAWATRLRTQLEFGAAILFFSLGSLAGYLQEANRLQVLGGDGGFCLALGGNGSKLLDWMRMKKEYPELLEMFQAGMKSRGVGINSYHLHILRSSQPKCEVARGLLEDTSTLTGDRIDITEVITDEKALEWNRAFIQAYNAVFDKKLVIDRHEIANLMTRVDRRMDVCNFFMDTMYWKYYINIIIKVK